MPYNCRAHLHLKQQNGSNNQVVEKILKLLLNGAQLVWHHQQLHYYQDDLVTEAVPEIMLGHFARPSGPRSIDLYFVAVVPLRAVEDVSYIKDTVRVMVVDGVVHGI